MVPSALDRELAEAAQLATDRYHATMRLIGQAATLLKLARQQDAEYGHVLAQLQATEGGSLNHQGGNADARARDPLRTAMHRAADEHYAPPPAPPPSGRYANGGHYGEDS